MGSGKEEPPGLGPEAREALSQFRRGIQRARSIVSAARQAIGRPGIEGVLLTGAPPEDKPPEDAPDEAETPPSAEPPPAPRPEQP